MEAVPRSADGPPSWRTLQYVLARTTCSAASSKRSRCSASRRPTAVTGFDIEFCKAIAAAVLGDATKVEYVDASDASTRFERLKDAESTC